MAYLIFFIHTQESRRAFCHPETRTVAVVVLLHTFFSRFICNFFLLKCSTASGTANCNAVIQIRALTPSRRLTVDSRGTLNSRSMFARRRRSIWWRLMAKKSVKTKYFIDVSLTSSVSEWKDLSRAESMAKEQRKTFHINCFNGQTWFRLLYNMHFSLAASLFRSIFIDQFVFVRLAQSRWRVPGVYKLYNWSFISLGCFYFLFFTGKVIIVSLCSARLSFSWVLTPNWCAADPSPIAWWLRMVFAFDYFYCEIFKSTLNFCSNFAINVQNAFSPARHVNVFANKIVWECN